MNLFLIVFCKEHHLWILSLIPPPKFFANNTDATFVIVYFCPRQQYKMGFNTDPFTVFVCMDIIYALLYVFLSVPAVVSYTEINQLNLHPWPPNIQPGKKMATLQLFVKITYVLITGIIMILNDLTSLGRVIKRKKTKTEEERRKIKLKVKFFLYFWNNTHFCLKVYYNFYRSMWNVYVKAWN